MAWTIHHLLTEGDTKVTDKARYRLLLAPYMCGHIIAAKRCHTTSFAPYMCGHIIAVKKMPYHFICPLYVWSHHSSQKMPYHFICPLYVWSHQSSQKDAIPLHLVDIFPWIHTQLKVYIIFVLVRLNSSIKGSAM